MQIVNVQQGSKEWHEFRAKHFNASEAPAMLGVSKYKTRAALLREKATGIVPSVDPETQKRFDAGHAAEAAARPIVEARMGVELFPATAEITVDGLPLGASFDGISMDEETQWENKLLNGSNGDPQVVIDAEHWPQLEQQMLVAGAKRVYFTVSDGTEAGTRGIWYESQPARRAQVLAGWKQFQADLANYQHVEDAPAPLGHAPDALPALHIEVTGMVKASNLDAFKSHALTVIGAIKTDLQTDEDFASAERTVKWCGEVEAKLDAAKQHALSQTASIDDLFRAIDQIKAEARAKRLELDKLVKIRKEAIRTEFVRAAQAQLTAHVDTLNKRLGKPYMPVQDTTRFGTAIKGLKTLASIRDAVSTELANAKIEANAVADKIEINLNTLRELAKDHAFLFHDTAAIVLKNNDDLTALVKTRIAEHKIAEDARLQKERERAVEAERERLRKEEEARQQAAPVVAPATVPEAAPLPTVTEIARKATEVSIVDAYLDTIKATSKKRAEIKGHIEGFLKFCSARKAAA